MSGIDRAFEVGFEQVKVNVVLMKNLNHLELPQFMAWIKTRPIQLRFIELMQTGEMDALFARHHVSGISIRDYLFGNGWLLKARADNDGPAQVFIHPDFQGEIGLIMPYEKDFCRSCNRLGCQHLANCICAYLANKASSYAIFCKTITKKTH